MVFLKLYSCSEDVASQVTALLCRGPGSHDGMQHTTGWSDRELYLQVMML